MDRSRRSLLKSGVASFTSVALFGKVSGSENINVRIRRNLDNPIEPSYIRGVKEELLAESSQVQDQTNEPRSEIILGEDEVILAYNLDIINGAPHEWVGSLKRQASSYQENSTLTGQTGAETVPASQSVSKIHSRAEENASKQEDHVSTGESQQNQRFTSTDVESSLSWRSDWDMAARNEWYKSDDYGNEIDWDVQWKKNPNNARYQGIYTELTANPQDYWHNLGGTIKHDINPTYSQVENYRPGNDNSKMSTSWSIGYSSDRTVDIGYSQSDYSEEKEVYMTGETTGEEPENVTHEYYISGDLKTLQNRFRSATVVDSNETYGEEFAHVKLQGHFESTGTPEINSNPENHYVYYW